MMEIDFFVPVYNPGEILEPNLRKIYGILEKNTKKFTLFVVDDHSTDDTPTTLGKINDLPHLKPVFFPTGPSRRENLATAIEKYLEKPFCGFCDIDLAVSAAQIPTALQKLSEYDIVIGNRYHQSKIIPRNKTRMIVSWLYRNLLQTYHGSNITDHQCGFKFFKASPLHTLLTMMDTFDHATQVKYNFPYRGWFWDAELLLLAQYYCYQIHELPVEWRQKESLAGFRQELKAIPYILRWHPQKRR